MSPFAPRKVVFSSRLWLEPTTFRGAKGDTIYLPFPAKGGLPVGRHAKEKTSFRGAKGDNERSTQFFPHDGLALDQVPFEEDSESELMIALPASRLPLQRSPLPASPWRLRDLARGSSLSLPKDSARRSLDREYGPKTLSRFIPFQISRSKAAHSRAIEPLLAALRRFGFVVAFGRRGGQQRQQRKKLGRLFGEMRNPHPLEQFLRLSEHGQSLVLLASHPQQLAQT